LSSSAAKRSSRRRGTCPDVGRRGFQ
jgi:hypothetical protein